MADANIEAIYRLSPLQEGILFHTLEAPGSDAYFQQYSCMLQQLDDVDSWRSAWQTVAQRHGVMRTLFTWEKRDQPLQIVRRQVSLPWQLLDWRHMGRADQLAEFAALQQRDRGRGFDLTEAPLMRFTLIQLDTHCYRFLWSFHHIALDGWSQRMILKQVLETYRDADTDTGDTDQAAPQYGEFIRWLDALDLGAARQFWTRQLQGFTAPTLIAEPETGRPDSADDATHGVQEVRLDPELQTRISEFARGNRLTLNTMVVAAWAKVLAAHTRVEEVVFGVTVSGRPVELPQAEGIAGLMINSLPMRVSLSPDVPLQDWLLELQSQQMSLQNYQHTPLVEIHRCADTPAGDALFDSIVVFENIPGGAESSSAGAPSVTEMSYTEHSHYPLALLVDPADGLTLIAVYQGDGISTFRAARLLQQMIGALESISGDLAATVAEVEVVPACERQQLFIEWNSTAVNYSTDRCIHQLFEETVLRFPENLALAGSADQLTFSQLNASANRLARHLTAMGVGAGQLVPVFMARGTVAVTTFLAVLKTGAAYIPLDSGFPRDRLLQILADLDGGPALVVTQPDLLEVLSDFDCRAICPELMTTELSQLDGDNLQRPVSHRDLAYVIYTSGSTGRPKGVMVEHRSLVNSTEARINYYDRQPEVFLLLSSLAVDSSVAGLYWCLCTGATVQVAAPRLELDVASMAQLIERAGVTHLLCIASIYQMILENGSLQQMQCLQAVIVAGESCHGGIVALHQQALPETLLYNEYGPSECTVWATVAMLNEWQAGEAVPIGRPIDNTELYVLDARRRPAPLGVAGELYIGGEGVARGYLNRPEETAAAFIEFNAAVSMTRASTSAVLKRLYKTGDLVRYREDGNLEFLGRVDNQIKLRGYRIEPEEIERVLGGHPDVAEVAVIHGQVSADSSVAQLQNKLEQLDEQVAEDLLAAAEVLAASSQIESGAG